MSLKTVVRRCAIGVGRRATSSGAVLSVPQSDSGVVVEVLTPRVVVATFEVLLLESLRRVILRPASSVPAVARPTLLLGKHLQQSTQGCWSCRCLEVWFTWC